MMKHYTWSLPELRERYADVDWDIVMPPRIRQRAVWASSGAIVISADTEHPDEAWELCIRFMDNDFQKIMAYRGLPANRIAAEEAIAGHIGDPANYRAFLKGADYMYPEPRIPHLQQLRQIFTDHVDQFRMGRLSAEDAARLADYELNRAIRMMKKRGM